MIVTEYIKYLFLLPAALIGITAVRSDYRHGKIENALIKKGIFFGILVYILLFVWTVFGMSGIKPFSYSFFPFEYFYTTLLNVGVGIVVGYLFWHYGLWAAGDAKLFYVYCLFLPVDFYSEGYFRYFPAIVLLLNIYLPAAIYIIGKGLVTRFVSLSQGTQEPFLSRIRRVIRRVFDLYIVNNSHWGTFLFGLAFLLLLMPFVRRALVAPFKGVGIFVFAASFGVMYLVQKIAGTRSSRRWVLIPFLGVTGAYFFYRLFISYTETTIILYQSLKSFILFILLFNAFRIISDFVVSSKDRRMVKADDIREGMFLEDALIQEVKNDEQFGIDFGTVTASGLSLQQSANVKKYLKKQDRGQVFAHHTVPFSAYIVLGACITVVLRQSAFHLLIRALLNHG